MRFPYNLYDPTKLSSYPSVGRIVMHGLQYLFAVSNLLNKVKKSNTTFPLEDIIQNETKRFV